MTGKNSLLLLATVALCVLCGGTATAQTWTESGDAGDLPGTAQTAAGTGALTTISGNFGASDVDMYLIRISNSAAFSATTVGGSTADTQIFLFTATGMGIACNDDSTGAQSTLPVGDALYNTLPAGVYLLAVSVYNRDPQNGSGLIFPNTFTGVLGPTGPGGGLPVASWSAFTTSASAYSIFLTGCEFVPPAPTVTGLSPNSGPTSGGTSVTITGTDFTGATAVNFGVVAATSFTVNSATQITATAPAQSAGTVNVTVTTPGGTSSTAGTADDYTYTAPEIDIQDGTATSIPSGGTYTLATPMLGGSTGHTLTFTILNTGNADLTISSAGTGGDSNCTSSMTTAPTSPVTGPTGTTNFIVTYNLAAGYGSFSFVITVNNNDSDEGTYTITVQGTRGLAGTYSINNGGGTPDFTDIGDAFDDLETFGVAGAVTLEIYDDGGDYTPTGAYNLGDLNPTSGIAGASATNSISIRAAAGESPVVNGNFADSWIGGDLSLGFSSVSYVSVTGLEITGGVDGGLVLVADAPTTDFAIRRCIIHGVTEGAGIFVWNPGGSGSVNNLVIQNNFVYNCANVGVGTSFGSLLNGIVTIRRPGSGVVISHNSILCNNGSNLNALGSTVASFDVDEVTFNIIACSSSGRFLMGWPTGDEPVISDYNLFHATGGAGFTVSHADRAAWFGATGLDGNSIEGNPLFVNVAVGSEDLHIQFIPTASPAINAAAGSTLNIDIDGDARPNGAGRDIGADEAQLNAAPSLALATGSSFTTGADFDLTLNPGATLASASLTASDTTPDPVNATITFTSGPMGATPPAGITQPANVTGGAGAGFNLTWTGTATASNDAGTYVWTVSLTDGVSTVNYSVRIFIVNLAPTHAAATGATGAGTVPSPYTRQHAVGNAGASNLATVADPNTSQTVSLMGTPTNTASPGTATITWSFAIVGGVLQATPSAAPAMVDVGDFDYTVVIQDNFSTPATTTFFVRISVITGTAPAITSTAITTATVGTLYTYTFTMTGTPTPTLSLTTGTLPAWLSLTGNTLSGTPPTGSAGTYGPFTFTATNGVAPDATQTFSIVVSNAGSGSGGKKKKGDDDGCSTGEGNNALMLLAGVMASVALALRLRRQSA